MERKTTLVLPRALHAQLRNHLFPGDGLEAAALLLCSVIDRRRQKWLACDLVPVPHSASKRRSEDGLSWPGDYVEIAIDRAESRNLAILAIHSHPGGFFAFSEIDNISDRTLMPAILHGTGRMPGSAIMVPSGAILARLFESSSGTSKLFDLVMSPGHEIPFWWSKTSSSAGPTDSPIAFTSAMTEWLQGISACVIGVSGTGSIVAEQLARLGFGEIILIDFDKVEHRNLNRILNSSLRDAEDGALKADMMADAIRRYRSNANVIAVPQSAATRDAVIAAAESDVLFSCVDTAEGRHIADRLSAFFAIPLFDVGVSIPTRKTANGRRAIAEVCGRVDYVYPGGSNLLDRGIYTGEALEAEYLARAAPETLRQKIADGYLQGMAEQAPAVITLNMRAASACVMEFIARAFPFRHQGNGGYAQSIFMLAEGEEEHQDEDSFTCKSSFPVAAGLTEPLLGLSDLGLPRVRQ